MDQNFNIKYLEIAFKAIYSNNWYFDSGHMSCDLNLIKDFTPIWGGSVTLEEGNMYKGYIQG